VHCKPRITELDGDTGLARTSCVALEDKQGLLNADASAQPCRGYDLPLKDGSHWWMLADEACADWLDKLGAILELRRCMRTPGPSNGSAPLFFSRTDDGSGLSDRPTNAVYPPGAAPPAVFTPGLVTGWRCEDHRAVRLWSHEDVPGVVCELIGPTDDDCLDYIRMSIALQPIYRGSIAAGGLLTHAALVEREGQGVLLAAPGGRGKSTCSRRLPAPWRALGDDAALVVLDRGHPEEAGTYWVHPFPTWSDYYWGRAENTWNVGHAVPLAGVFFLEQAEVTDAAAIGAGQAALRMTESAMQICEPLWRGLDAQEARRARMLLFDNACHLARVIPAFVLHVNLNGAFWEEMEEALDWQG
jgi:SynChlorMet cassette protein ScmC